MTMFSQGSVLSRPLQRDEKVNEITEVAFFESVDDTAMLESIEKLNSMNIRKDAAAACSQWVAGGDCDFNELDAMLYGMAGGDGDDLTDSQMTMYESLQDAAAEFISQHTNNDEFDFDLLNDDENRAELMFESLESALSPLDQDEAIAEFAVRNSMMLEAKKKVIRNGEVKVIKTKKRKVRLSPAQRAALKKARKKSHSGAAKAARKKSLRVRKSRGM